MDSSFLTFANHGCGGEYNIGLETEFDEMTALTEVMPDEVAGRKSFKFSPVIDRHLGYLQNVVEALDDIPAGDEILDNYLAFTSDEADWAHDVKQLREQCSGGAAGDVTSYERKRMQ